MKEYFGGLPAGGMEKMPAKPRPEAEIRADDPDRDAKFERFQAALDASKTKPRDDEEVLDVSEEVTDKDDDELEETYRELEKDKLILEDESVREAGQFIYQAQKAGYSQDDIERLLKQEAAKIKASVRPNDEEQAIIDDILKEAEEERQLSLGRKRDADPTTRPLDVAGSSEPDDDTQVQPPSQFSV